MFKLEKLLTPELCSQNPNALVVFGDNLIEKGKAGQAIIRDCPNSYGVPTKRLPSMKYDAFFSDKKEEYEKVKEKLIYLWNEHENGKTIILPIEPIGSGLANIKEKSPIICQLIERFYNKAKECIREQQAYEHKTKNGLTQEQIQNDIYTTKPKQQHSLNQ